MMWENHRILPEMDGNIVNESRSLQPHGQDVARTREA